MTKENIDSKLPKSIKYEVLNIAIIDGFLKGNFLMKNARIFSSFQLKIIAIVAMVVDHVEKADFLANPLKKIQICDSI